MAVTHTIVARRRFLRGHDIVVSTVLSSTYPAGGEVIAAADVGVSAFDIVTVTPTGGFIVAATPTTPSAGGTFTSFKLRFFGDDAASAGAGFIEVSAGAYPSFVSTGSPIHWSAVCR